MVLAQNPLQQNNMQVQQPAYSSKVHVPEELIATVRRSHRVLVIGMNVAVLSDRARKNAKFVFWPRDKPKHTNPNVGCVLSHERVNYNILQIAKELNVQAFQRLSNAEIKAVLEAESMPDIKEPAFVPSADKVEQPKLQESLVPLSSPAVSDSDLQVERIDVRHPRRVRSGELKILITEMVYSDIVKMREDGARIKDIAKHVTQIGMRDHRFLLSEKSTEFAIRQYIFRATPRSQKKQETVDKVAASETCVLIPAKTNAPVSAPRALAQGVPAANVAAAQKLESLRAMWSNVTQSIEMFSDRWMALFTEVSAENAELRTRLTNMETKIKNLMDSLQ